MGKISVVIIGPFPEPVQGAAIITAKVFDLLVHRGVCLSKIDLSPGSARGWRYHLVRVAKTASGFFRILCSSATTRYFMSLDGGMGLIYNLVLALAVRIRGRPLLLYHHSAMYVFRRNFLMQTLISVAGKKVMHVMCSGAMLALFRERYNLRMSALVINNAAWVDVSSASEPTRRSKMRLGHLSGLSMEKGLGRAIETLRELRRRGVDAELVLAGAAQDVAAQKMIELAQVEFGDALTHAGVLIGKAKSDFYASLDYFLFPSLYRYETQSLVIPEALAAGVPVIAYDHRFVGELLGQGGCLVPCQESFALVAVDWILLEDDRDRRCAARSQLEMLRCASAGQVDVVLNWITDEGSNA